MITNIVKSVLANRLWTLGAALIVSVAGLVSLSTIPIDAVPDITGVQIMVNTRTGGLDPERIERTVTFPIESELTGVPGVDQIRSISRFGLSQVTVVFAEGTDIWKARQQIGERLSGIRESLPAGLHPELAPVTTGLGEVLIYTIHPKPGSPLATKSSKERLTEMRTIQDFVIRPALKRLTGVADVDTNGGFKKEIHIDLIPAQMEAYGVTIGDVVRATERIGDSSGGGYIQRDGKQIIVRAGATADSLEALANLPVRLEVSGSPVRLSQVAKVRPGNALRVGAATHNGEESMLGTVLMLTGANSRQVAHEAAAALGKVPLPTNIEVEILYSRAFLVDATIRTVGENLGLGAALVIAILLAFLGNVRAALLVAVAIPLSMLAAAAGMKYAGLSANLMSLGAVDFGLLVDASIVVVDNVSRKMDESRGASLTIPEELALVQEAVAGVASPVVFGLCIIMLVYVPILSFSGIEGKMFRPMALTVIMALGASLLVALCIIPPLAFLLLFARKAPGDPLVFRAARRIHTPMLAFVMRRRLAAVLTALLAFAGSLVVLHRMGSDFIPELDEGDLLINVTRDTNIGLDAAVEAQKNVDRLLRTFPEVERVFCRLGTNEAATDPMGINYADTFVILKKDRESWPLIEGRRRSKDELYMAMRKAVEVKYPDDELAPTQPIQMRFNEILEGSRADVTLRIVGPDLETLMELVEKAEGILKPIRGAQEVEMDALTSLRKSAVLDIRADPARMAAFGVRLSDLYQVFETGTSGQRVGSYYEGDRRFPVIVHVDETVRNDIRQIRDLPIELADGGTVPLRQLSHIEQKEQVTTIARYYGERYAAVAIFLSNRDVESFVNEAREKMKAELHAPEGYRFEWGGQFENLAKARLRLGIVIPITLVLVFLLLLRNLGTVRHALLVYTAVPFAMTGGIFSLAIRGIPFSISAAVGFIAVSGIALLNGIVLMHFMKELRAAGRSALETAVEGANARLRPVLMTALVASLGFVPMALNTGIGAEVQRPLATVVIGGIITSTLLTMFLLPALYEWLERDRKQDFGGRIRKG